MNDKYEAIRLKNQLCFPIYLCAKEIVNKYAAPLSELDLTYTQYVIMMYFWERGRSNAKELSKITMLDPSTLTPLLKKLESKGYIQREYYEQDKRNIIISLTEKGEKLKEKALSIPGIMKKCIDLSDSECVTLYTILYKTLNNLKKGYRHERSTGNRK